MTRMTRLTAPALTAVALLVLAGCAAGPDTTPTEAPAATAVPTSPAPTSAGDPTEEPAGDPTCETIIPASTAADFAEVGWSARSDPFRIGSTELSDGIMCTWGDYSIATDHVQIYGWAPIDEAQSREAMDELLGSGWTREDGPDGVYVTESSDTAIATDDDGYGMTYLFGDGWVKMADTKQGLILVEWGS